MEEQLWSFFFGILTVIIGFLIKNWMTRFMNKMEKKNAEIEAKQEKIEKIIEESEKNYQWNQHQEELLQTIQEKQQTINERLDLLIAAGLALLCDRIGQSCIYYISQGSITSMAKMNIGNMYRWYSLLSKDDLVKDFYQNAMSLPVDDSKQRYIIHFPEYKKETYQILKGDEEQ